MELKILGSICFLEAVGTVGNIMGYHLGAGICLAGTSLLTVYTVYLMYYDTLLKKILKSVRYMGISYRMNLDSTIRLVNKEPDVCSADLAHT